VISPVRDVTTVLKVVIIPGLVGSLSFTVLEVDSSHKDGAKDIDRVARLPLIKGQYLGIFQHLA
jgi:hypothetical protein